MGDHAVVGSTFSSYDDPRGSSARTETPLPPQALARWAAIARDRACGAALPRQVLAKS